MAEFNAALHNLKPSFSLMNPNMELLSNLGSFENQINSNMPINESFLDHQHHHELPILSIGFGDYGGSFCEPAITTQFLPSPDAVGPSCSKSKTPTRNKNTVGGRKRKRNSEREHLEKPGDVIHVRAKRGQATDSHSLAERLRREKINEKLRSLQDLVPGCYKTMGMAVMLDVIINYVRSLQNQIDFLSMKLSAASVFHDFNSEMEAIETIQGTNGYEAPVMEPIVGEGYGLGGGGFSYFP